MNAKEILFGSAAQRRIIAGAVVMTRAVKATLGPRGRNVLVERPFGAPVVTKDGVSVARAIELEGRMENVGAALVRSVAVRTSELAGDGTTTATVLAQAILEEGQRAIVVGIDPMALKRGVDRATAAVVAALAGQARPCRGREAIAQVATVSANGEGAIGELIAEAIERVGVRGAVTIEEGSTLKDRLEVVEGIRFAQGWLSPYFVTEREGLGARLEAPCLLLYDDRLTAVDELLPLLEAVSRERRPLLVVAEAVEGEALATLVLNKVRGILPTVAVKAPGVGERRTALLEDLALLGGGEVIGGERGTALARTTVDRLGSAREVVVERDRTTVIGGGGARATIDRRIAELHTRAEGLSPGAEREGIEERIAKLAGGVAVVKVGGAGESEMRERKDRVDDALHATRAAVEEGVVPGGGVALLRALQAVDRDALLAGDPDEARGVAIVLHALTRPFREIVANLGGGPHQTPEVVLDRVLAGHDDYGFDAQAERYGALFALGILDPAKVVRIALQSAASVAGLMITTEAIIAADRGRGVTEG